MNGNEEQLNLLHKSKDFKIKIDDVVDILVKNHESKLNEFVSLGSFKAEVFIKIATDNDFTFDKNYYYICVCDREGNCFDFIVDVDSGNVIATKS